jgi:uncharacterized protein (DUF1800 family)
VALPLTALEAAHLLRRAAFGGTIAEINALLGKTRDEAATQLLGWTNGDTGGDMSTAEIALLNDFNSRWYEDRYVPLQRWWYTRMATDPFPLREKLTLFWHGHFCSELHKISHFGRMYEQIQLFRKYAKGNFIQFVKDVSLQPTMLIYLDNESSKKGHPNVNFARELLELFTLGVGATHYTEPDIFAMANAWTGYGVQYPVFPAQDPAVMRFYPENHETAPSTFMGVTDAWDATGDHGRNIMDFLFVQRQSVAAKFMAKKLFEFFAYENPAQGVVDGLATAFINSGFSIEALVRAILVSDEFYSPAARQGRLRSPVEWFVAVMRTTQLTVVDAYPEGSNIALGQELLNPPNVAGWKLNDYWISTACFWAKGAVVDGFGWRVHDRASWHGSQPPVAVWLPIIDDFTKTNPTATAQQVAQAAFDAAGLVAVSAQTRTAIESFLNQLLLNNDRWFARAGLLQALLLSPDFQLA